MPNRSVYVIGAPPRENFSSKRGPLSGSAAQAVPAPAGNLRPFADHGFYLRENIQNNIPTLHHITSAETPRPLCIQYGVERATATLRPRHLLMVVGQTLN